VRHVALLKLSLVLVATLSGCVHWRVVPSPEEKQGGEVKEPPPGTVDLEVVSEDEGLVWDVYAGNEVVCTTPCAKWIDARQPLRVVSRKGDRVPVPRLGLEAEQARRAVLVTRGLSKGKYVNGIVFTTLGGMGVAVATTLTAVGCSDLERRSGMCTAGLITMGVSVPLTAAAIWMLVDSVPSAHVIPVYKTQVAKGQPPLTVAFGPNAIHGTF
jgi:hypothetical protein